MPELLETSFATFERNIRDQLSRTLAGGGFDPARDIEAITVNRWPHGYAPEYNPLWDPDGPESQRPNVIGRAKFGKIAIANSDAGGAAYTDSAIAAGGSRGERVVEGVGVAASLWSATAAPGPVLGTLSESVRAQVAIIGAGYTGLSAALHLAEAGRDVVVLEAVDVGERASGLNGGQVIPGVKHDPDTLEEMFGPVVGSRLVDTVASGPDVVFDLIRKYEIACAATRTGWIQPATSAAAMEMICARVGQWRRRGADVELLSAAETARLTGSQRYVGGWIDRRGGTVQPLSYVRGLARAARAAGRGFSVTRRRLISRSRSASGASRLPVDRL